MPKQSGSDLMTIIIQNLAIGGYRSFGKDPQYFNSFKKVNLLIGQNNSGKSNVLRFIQEVYGKTEPRKTLTLDPLTQHLPERPPLLLGIAEDLETLDDGAWTLKNGHRLLQNFSEGHEKQNASVVFGKLMKVKADLDKTDLCWNITNSSGNAFDSSTWSRAIKAISDPELRMLWSKMFKMSGGDRNGTWEPNVLSRIALTPPSTPIATIPAIRRIGKKGLEGDEFDGAGIIEKLAKLQNPDVHNQSSRERFQDITKFLRDVIDRNDATIEIPYERDTILVHMDEKVLPVESLGSGIHEVLIIAAAATVLNDYVICVEEPELHLNPILQRKLIRYLQQHTKNQYFISTHSAALMDTPNIEVYHIRLETGCSIVERATADRQRSVICADLGYHPSDLLQANCIIWVEGPSDRLYLNWWIAETAPDFIEGIHYSIMFYGGRLASHLSNANDTEISEFISLRRLNRHGCILIDSDRNRPHARINSTKQRLSSEFNDGPGHAWITEGREIENYISADRIKSAISATSPNSIPLTQFERYDNVLSVRLPKGKEGHASKVEIARYVTTHFKVDTSILDLRQRIERLCTFIKDSNPT